MFSSASTPWSTFPPEAATKQHLKNRASACPTDICLKPHDNLAPVALIDSSDVIAPGNEQNLGWELFQPVSEAAEGICSGSLG